MYINRKPCEQVEIDWAGDPEIIIDSDTGEIIKAYIFGGVMIYSQYTYVEAFLDMKKNHGLMLISICTSSLVVLLRSSYWITAKLQFSQWWMKRPANQ